jgi:hypothetical protein
MSMMMMLSIPTTMSSPCARSGMLRD